MNCIKYIGLFAAIACCAGITWAQNTQTKTLPKIQPKTFGTNKLLPKQRVSGEYYMQLVRDVELQQKLQRLVAQQQLEMEEQKGTQPRCAQCGEVITNPNQRCSDTGTYCKTAEAVATPNNYQEPQTVCPCCGQALSIDERYHGAKHECRCAAQKPASAPRCAACGQTITGPQQHCSATNYAGICSAAPNKAQQEKNVQTSDSSCNCCGKELSLDERYHCDGNCCNTCQAGNAQTNPVHVAEK